MTSASSHCRAGLALLAVFACGPGARRSSAAPDPTPANGPATAQAHAPAPTTARPAGISGAPVPDDVPTFAVVARTAEPVTSGRVALLRAGDGQPLLAAGPLVLRLSADGALAADPSSARGIDDQQFTFGDVQSGCADWEIGTFGGTWPDGAYIKLVSRLCGSVSGWPMFARRSGGVWTSIDTRRDKYRWYPVSIGPWKDGSWLALKHFYPHGTLGAAADKPWETWQALEKLVAGEDKFAVLGGSAKPPKIRRHDVRSAASLPTGQLFALVEEGGRAAVLHYDDAGPREQILALPVPDGQTLLISGLAAAAPDRAWAFGSRESATERSKGYLARFDGAVWTAVEPGCLGSVRSLSIAADGDPYFVCGVLTEPGGATVDVLLRVHGGAVEELPTPVEPSAVVAKRADDIWLLSAVHGAPAQLLHSGAAPGQPQRIPGPTDGARAVLEWADPHPVVDNCRHLWVPLTAGSDRAAVTKRLADASKQDFSPALIDARVQGRIEAGVALVIPSGKGAKRALKTLQSLLGAAAGTPSCNERVPAGDEPRG